MREDDEIRTTGQKMFDVYMDGFTSGICSTLSTFSTFPQEVIMEIAQRIGNGVCDDEGKAMLYNEIQERLDGEDSGPKHSDVPIAIPQELLRRTKAGEN